MKYIIDIPDKAIDFMGGRDHFSMFVEPECKVDDCKHYALRISKGDIEPYTEPDRKAIEDEVWDFATSCIDMEGIDFYRCFEDDTVYCLTEYTYSEAKSKYDEWKRKEKEIRVGDEVVSRFDKKAYIIYHIDRDKQVAYGIDVTGGYPLMQAAFPMHGWYIPNKTGKHFSEIAELLKKIRGEE